MADNRDEVFDDVHYELEFKKDGIMTTVISDNPQTIQKFLKCHNLDINLMQISIVDISQYIRMKQYISNACKRYSMTWLHR